MEEHRGRYISVGQLSQIMDVSKATIRSWEDRYGWPCPSRTKGLHRRYKRSELARFHEIAKLRRRMTTKEALEHLKNA